MTFASSPYALIKPAFNPFMFSRIKNQLFDHPLWRMVRWDDDHPFDLIGPVCILLLAISGVIFIHSAQAYSAGSSWKMQILWIMVGSTLYLAISLVNYKLLLEYAHHLYLLSLIPLLLLWTPLGDARGGALRWLDFGFFSLQPTELAKIGTLIMLSSLLARSELGNMRQSLQTLLKVLAVFSLPIILIFLQPDLGSSLVFLPMVFALLYMSKLSQRFFVVVLALFLLVVSVFGLDTYRYYRFMEQNNLSFIEDRGAFESQSLLPLHDYQRNRILAFVAPDVVDPRGTGASWNRNQSLIAVGSGGLTGKGIGQGTQPQLGYLPQSVAPNDFIFSVLAEEAGFIGGTLIIILFFLLIMNGLRIAGLAKDRFGALLAVGISTIFLIHVFINIGMTLGLMPITGLPLPFLSYGGSFIVSCFILQGITQSVYRFRKDFT